MSATPKTALQLVDELIAKVNKLAVVAGATKDVAWAPIVPRGHTSFTWSGTEEPAVTKSTASATTPAPAAAAPAAAATPAPAAATTAAPAPAAATETKKPEQQKKQEKPQQQQQQQGKQEKQQKQQKQGKQENKAAETKVEESSVAPIARMEFRVGQVIKAERHPNADKMYVEMIDVGEKEPRQICSGLVGLVPLEELATARVVVVTNLAAAKLRDVMSAGMVLAASNADHTQATLVVPPAGAKVGERIFVQGMEEEFKNAADKEINIKKAGNPWGVVAPDLRTDASGRACYKGAPLLTSAGACTSTLKDAIVK